MCRVVLPALSVLTVLSLSGCDPEPSGSGGGTSTGSSESGNSGQSAEGFGVSPLDNADGTKPGLAPLITEADKAVARKIIEQVATKGRGPKTGYDRDEFGYAWMDTADGVPLARNGCDTRNDLLKLNGQKLEFREGSDCVVMSMTLYDPYTGKEIAWKKTKATEVQIDHVVSVAATPKSSRSPL